MIRRAEWTVNLGSNGFRLRPLTVRERLMLSEDLSNERAEVAATDGRAAGLPPVDLAEYIGEARRKAAAISSLYLDCYSVQGQVRVLTVVLGDDVDSACKFVESCSPRDATRACLEALGIDTEQLDKEDTATSGNA